MQYFCVSSMLFCGTKNPARHRARQEGTLNRNPETNEPLFLFFSFFHYSSLCLFSVELEVKGLTFIPAFFFWHSFIISMKFALKISWSILVNIRPPFGFVMVTVLILLSLCSIVYISVCALKYIMLCLLTPTKGKMLPSADFKPSFQVHIFIIQPKEMSIIPH